MIIVTIKVNFKYETKLPANSRTAAQTRAYYDSLTPSEQDEAKAWGKFAESEMGKLVFEFSPADGNHNFGI